MPTGQRFTASTRRTWSFHREDAQRQRGTAYRKSAISRSIAVLYRAPTSCLTTSPPANTLTVGTSITPYLTVVCGFSSALIFTTSIASACSAAMASSTGPSWRHGPHHCAQYSTTTGFALRSTSASKLSSVTVLTTPMAVFPSIRDAPSGAGGELVVPVARLPVAPVPVAPVPIAPVPIAQLEGQAVVAAALRADLDQAAQPALQLVQLGELVRDRRELRLGGPDDLAGGTGLGRAEQVADLGQGEAEPPGPADERQPPPVVVGVLGESRPAPRGPREQAAPLVEPHGLDADPSGLGEFPDRQPSHGRKLTAVLRYGVKRRGIQGAPIGSEQRRCRRECTYDDPQPSPGEPAQ